MVCVYSMMTSLGVAPKQIMKSSTPPMARRVIAGLGCSLYSEKKNSKCQPSLIALVRKTVIQSINQSIEDLINRQANNQSVNQSINRSEATITLPMALLLSRKIPWALPSFSTTMTKGWTPAWFLVWSRTVESECREKMGVVDQSSFWRKELCRFSPNPNTLDEANLVTNWTKSSSNTSPPNVVSILWEKCFKYSRKWNKKSEI